MRFDCAGASGSRVRPFPKITKKHRNRGLRTNTFQDDVFKRKSFLNDIKREAWGLPKSMKNEVEVRCGLEVSVFQKKVPKRRPRGHPTELLLVPFGSLGVILG